MSQTKRYPKHGWHSSFMYFSISQAFSDPTHTLRNYLNEQGLIEVKITDRKASSYFESYVHGIVQPGVLYVDKYGTKLFSWAIDPNTVLTSFSLCLMWITVLISYPAFSMMYHGLKICQL